MTEKKYDYFEKIDNEYRIKQNVSNLDKTILEKEIESIKESTKVYLDTSIKNSFITPISLLIITGAAVAIVSIVLIAFSVILKNDFIYIPLSVAYLLWVALVVIVVIDNKRKRQFLNDPVISVATLLDDSEETKKGYFLHFKEIFSESEEELFLKTSIGFEKLNEEKQNIYNYYKEMKRFFVIVYKDRKQKSYPIRLLTK